MLSLWVFWVSTALVLFAYVGYPLVLALCSRLFGRTPVPPAADTSPLPLVSVLVIARNEQAVIEARLANLAEQDYPADRLQIVVASDDSTDATNDIVQRWAARGVELEASSGHAGKAAALNRVLPGLKGEIVVLSDANTFFAPDTVSKLVRWFADPSIGVVCGKLKLIDHVTGENADGLYWRYETALKMGEARLGGLLGANGANYAIRREQFRPIPGNTIVEDLVLPLVIRLHTDCRVIFDTEAIAYEETAPSIQDEFRRRTRIGTGGFQAIGLLWRLANPLRGWIAMSFLCHKVLRWLCPFLLLAMLVSNALLIAQPIYLALMVAQLLFHGTAAALQIFKLSGRLPGLLRLAVMFQSMNLALLLGFWFWLRGNSSGAWSPSARSGKA